MSATNSSAHLSLDARCLRWVMAGVVVLLAIIAVELSALNGPLQARAHAQPQAQLPDSGAQLNQLIEGQKQIKSTLDQILEQLKNGEIKVALGSTDKETRATLGSTSAPRTSKPSVKPQPSATRAK